MPASGGAVGSRQHNFTQFDAAYLKLPQRRNTGITDLPAA